MNRTCSKSARIKKSECTVLYGLYISSYKELDKAIAVHLCMELKPVATMTVPKLLEVASESIKGRSYWVAAVLQLVWGRFSTASVSL